DALCLACAIPLAGLAADPHQGGGGGRGPGNNGPNRGGPGGDWRGDRDREKELAKDFDDFCKDHAHNRWLELKAHEADPAKNVKPRMFTMLWKFRALKALETSDHQLYEIQVKQLEPEDAGYGLQVKQKNAE